MEESGVYLGLGILPTLPWISSKGHGCFQEPNEDSGITIIAEKAINQNNKPPLFHIPEIMANMLKHLQIVSRNFMEKQ